MKLYATVTSERASKGQGGNSFVEVTLVKEDRTLDYTIMYTVNGLAVYNEQGALILDTTEKCAACGEQMHGRVRVHHHTENGEDVTKGEKEKGKCDECGDNKFCGDCGGCQNCTRACKNTIDSHNP